MKKAKSTVIVVLALIVIMAMFMLVACSETEHKHTFAEGWTSDATNHWHAATCGHDEEKSEVAAHVDEDENGKCDVCDYEMMEVPPATHEHTFSESWSSDENSHWHAVTCGHDEEKSGEAAHVDANSDDKCDVCNYEMPHVHRYSDEWSTSETEHWHSPICGDTITPKDKDEHDFEEEITPATCTEAGEKKYTCSVCHYVKTEVIEATGHSYEEEWTTDATNHWHAATCEHETEKGEFGAHVDADNDEYCDVCEYHDHKFEEAWTVNEFGHYHKATCTDHAYERGGEENHDFTSGSEPDTCKCGVKQIEVDVYNKFTQHPSYDNKEFDEYLEWLKSENITELKLNDAGDVVYHYGDGHEKIAFLGLRTVKIKTTDITNDESKPLANVWFMVARYVGNASTGGFYQELSNHSLALGIGKSDEDGNLELEFNPVGGYTNEMVHYHIRIAEAKDVSKITGVREDMESPIPERYLLVTPSDGYVEVAISEDGVEQEEAVEYQFKYSKSWAASKKFTLPYRRYWTDQVHGTGLIEDNKTPYIRTLTGNDYFDYFYFTSYYYSGYSQSSGTIEDNLAIIDNAKIAAAGTYRISFKVNGEGSAVLYYWNEELCELDAYLEVSNQPSSRRGLNSDGTPSDRFITAISGTKPEGSTIADAKYTGGNYVDVNIAPQKGLRHYQLGIKSDSAVSVTITVERLGDYGSATDYEFTKKEDTEGVYEALKVSLPRYGEPKSVSTVGIPDGYYMLESSVWKPNGMFVYFDNDKNQTVINDGTAGRAIVKISSEKKLWIYQTGISGASVNLTLTKCEPKLTDSEPAYLPTTKHVMDEIYEVKLEAKPGTYTITIDLNSSKGLPTKLTVKIGEKTTEIKRTLATAGSAEARMCIGEITIEEGDDTIALITTYDSTTSRDGNLFCAKVELTPKEE